MKEDVNVTELKTHLSRYLRLASKGRRIWTHDDRQGAAALSRGLTVRGVQIDGTTLVPDRPSRERDAGNA
jgi:antitoxin (DNA-binding transcriptional repressor) of toxin-antitoxin stability system